MGKSKPKQKPVASKAKPERASGGDVLLSVNAASDILHRTRRTLARALMDLRPDKIESGIRLWRLSRIVSALNNTFAPILTSSAMSDELEEWFARLNAADAEMRAIESLAGRRAFARQTLLPLLRETDRAMRADGKACGELEMLTQLRCDQHLRVFLVSGLGPDATGGCDWSPSQCWDAYNNAGDDGEDETEAA